MKKIIVILVLVLLIAALGAGGWYYLKLQAQPTVTATGLMEKIEDSSELTVAKNYYTGIVRFKEGTIPLINKNGFTMKYEAVIDAGFDLEGVEIDVTDAQVLIEVPEAVVQSVTIDPDSLEFYDNKFSIIKSDRKEATKMALVEAEKDAGEHATNKGLLDEANKRAEVIFKGILAGSVGDREIVVEIRKAQ
jgi:hypothetical protein